MLISKDTVWPLLMIIGFKLVRSMCGFTERKTNKMVTETKLGFLG